jgi:hypothetical protein
MSQETATRAGLVGEARCTWSHLLLLGLQERSPHFSPSPATRGRTPLTLSIPRLCSLAEPTGPAQVSRAYLYTYDGEPRSRSFSVAASLRHCTGGRRQNGRCLCQPVWERPSDTPQPPPSTLGGNGSPEEAEWGLERPLPRRSS